MKHYPHHIGDFDRATRHLTRIERSIYRDLIELYYDTEKPLSLDKAWLCRHIIARSNEEATAVEQVLNEFFTEIPNGWWHERCEEELDKYRANNSQKALAGKASAAKRALKKHQALNGNSTDVPTAVQQANNGTPTNHQPSTINHKPGGGSAEKSPPVDNSNHPPPIPLEFQEVLNSRPELPDPGAIWLNFVNHYETDDRTIARWRKWVATEFAPKPQAQAGPPPITVPGRPGKDPHLAKLDAEDPKAAPIPFHLRTKFAGITGRH